MRALANGVAREATVHARVGSRHRVNSQNARLLADLVSSNATGGLGVASGLLVRARVDRFALDRPDQLDREVAVLDYAVYLGHRPGALGVLAKGERHDPRRN